MTWNKFLKDLATWVEYETKVVEALYKAYWIKMKKNEDVRGVDLLHELFSLEVKCDRQMTLTWNMYVEVSCNWKKSWIFKEEEINYEYFAYGCDEWFAIFDKEVLQQEILEWVLLGKYQLKKWGDGFRTIGCLLPVEPTVRMAKGIIYF